MRKTTKAHDVSGRAIAVGDTVATVTGDLTGRVSAICEENKTEFVCVRPLYRLQGRGEWHAADRLVRLAAARPKPVAATNARHKS